MNAAPGFKYLSDYEYDYCFETAANSCAHLHPDKMCVVADWRHFSLEQLPPECGEEFKGTQRDQARVIVDRTSGDRVVVRAKTKRTPVAFNCDSYCRKRIWHDDGVLGMLPNIGPLPINEHARDKLKRQYEELVDDEAESDAIAREAEWEAAVKDKQPLDDGDPKVTPSISATPYTYRPPSFIQPREWIYGSKIIRKYVSLTVAPSGIGKSSKALVEAIAMVTGRDLLGVGFEPERPFRVWYWCGEDPSEEIERRIAAILLHYEIDPAEIGGRLFIDSGREKRIRIAYEDRGTLKFAVPHANDIATQIRLKRIDVMVVDPFVSSHGVTENDNSKIDAVVKLWCEIAEKTNCAILLVHHVRKGAHGQYEHTVDDGRGASALLAASRVAEVLNVMSPEEADKFGIETNRRRSFFRCDNGKSSMAPPAEQAEWHQIVSVDLGNERVNRKTCYVISRSDNVGVVTAWKPPNPFEDVTVAHLRAIVKVIDGGEYRENSQSPDWAGNAVAEALGLDPQNPAAKAKIKRLLKTWIANGALKVVERPVKREMKKFIVGGQVIDLKVAAP